METQQIKGNWMFFVIGLLIVIVAVLGFYLWQTKKPPIEPKSVVETAESDWSRYINRSLGFELWIPKRVLGTASQCTRENFFVPLKVFEDDKNNVVYISPEYYYDNRCEKKIYSLESLRNEIAGGNGYRTNKSFLGWGIAGKTVKNDTELDKFIKESFGSSCSLGKKEELYYYENYPLYNVIVESGGMESDCPLNYQYKVLYYSGRNKAMSVALGQECTFIAAQENNYSAYLCYDDIIIESFRFTITE